MSPAESSSSPLLVNEQVSYSLWKHREGKEPVQFLLNLSLKDANRLAESYNADKEPGVVYHAAREVTVTSVEFDPAETTDRTTRHEGVMGLDGLTRLLAESEAHLD